MKTPRKKKNDIKPVYSVNHEELIFRDLLAADRTALANERTFLAYIRTSLAFIAAGFGLIKFTTETLFIVMGWILIPVGALLLALGIYRFFKIRKVTRDISCEYDINGQITIDFDEEKDKK
ncbi:MAG: YidH family protein [Candidatus Heimdallarchaeota archaeon]